MQPSFSKKHFRYQRRGEYILSFPLRRSLSLQLLQPSRLSVVFTYNKETYHTWPAHTKTSARRSTCLPPSSTQWIPSSARPNLAPPSPEALAAPLRTKSQSRERAPSLRLNHQSKRVPLAPLFRRKCPPLCNPLTQPDGSRLRGTHGGRRLQNALTATIAWSRCRRKSESSAASITGRRRQLVMCARHCRLIRPRTR